MLLFAAIGVATVHDYGITWDEPENFMVGRIYLNAYIHRSLSFLNTPENLPIPPPIPFRLETQYERYPPFAATLASLSSFLFAEKLHLLHPVDAHHIVVIVFGAIALGATAGIVWTITGSPFATITGMLLLATHPVFVGHSRSNIKDIPGMAMQTLSLFLFVRLLKKKSLLLMALWGISLGLAVSTKASSIMILPVAVLFCLVVLRKRIVNRKRLPTGIAATAIVVFFLLASVLASWPWFIHDPMEKIGLLRYYADHVARGYPLFFQGIQRYAGPWLSRSYAPVMTAITTPLPFLLLSILGLITSYISCFHSTVGARFRALPFIWITLIFSRYVFFSMTVYNGIRHFLEILPAMAISAGVFLWFLENRLRRWNRGSVSIIMAAGTAAIVIYQTILSIRLHPYQMLYFNALAGGMAKAQNEYEFDYWGFSLKEMVDYLNTLPDPQHIVAHAYWVPVKSEYFPNNRITFTQREKDMTHILIANNRGYSTDARNYWQTHGKLIYTVHRNGAEIGYIFENLRNRQ